MYIYTNKKERNRQTNKYNVKLWKGRGLNPLDSNKQTNTQKGSEQSSPQQSCILWSLQCLKYTFSSYEWKPAAINVDKTASNWCWPKVSRGAKLNRDLRHDGVLRDLASQVVTWGTCFIVSMNSQASHYHYHLPFYCSIPSSSRWWHIIINLRLM